MDASCQNGTNDWILGTAQFSPDESQMKSKTFWRTILILSLLVSLHVIFRAFYHDSPRASSLARWIHRSACDSSKGLFSSSPIPSDIYVKSLIEDYRLEFEREPPPGFDRWIRFASDHQCSLASITYQRIEKDLSRFREHHGDCISKKKCKATDAIIPGHVLEHVADMPFLKKVEIKSGMVHVEGKADQDPHARALSHFAEFLPDMKIYLNLLDEPRVLRIAPKQRMGLLNIKYNESLKRFTTEVGTNIIPLMKQVCDLEPEKLENHGFFLGANSFSTTSVLVPIFSSTSIRACFSDILIPSHYFLGAAPDEHWAEPVPISAKTPSYWRNKKSVVYWRGSNTGGGSLSNNLYKQFHRHRLVKEFGPQSSHQQPTSVPLFDVALTAVLQCIKDLCDELKSTLGPIAGPDPLSATHSMKYLIDIDGNSFSQRFLPFLRFTGSVIIKLFMFEDWVTEQTRDGEHYVQANLDLHDLVEKVNYLRTHDDEARKIAAAGQLYAAQRLRYDDMLCYWYRLLLEYHQLTVPGNWTRVSA